MIRHFLGWLEPYIDGLQHLIAANVVLTPLLLLFMEEMGVPLLVPGDAILAYIGYKIPPVSGRFEFWAAFATAEIAILAGASILFFLSRRYGQTLIIKVGKFVFLKEKQVRRAEHLFAKNAVVGIIVGRHIPGLRIAVTVFAGAAGIRYRTFIASTFVSAAVWILFFFSLGKRFGADFRATFEHYTSLSLLALAALFLGIIGLHIIGEIQERRARRKRETT